MESEPRRSGDQVANGRGKINASKKDAARLTAVPGAGVSFKRERGFSLSSDKQPPNIAYKYQWRSISGRSLRA